MGFIEISFGLGIIAAAGIGSWFAFKFGNPSARVHEYISYYKIGRVKQFATEHDINIDEIMAYEDIRDSKKLQKSWTEKIEAKISKDLEDIEKLNEPKEKHEKK